MITYVDTSTLIKLLVDERGSERAQLIWDTAETLVTVRLTIVEARSALAAALRAGRLNVDQHDAAARELEVLWSSLNVVELTAELAEQAGEIAMAHALRGYDAVHLAGAVLAGAELLTSADDRLCAAAQAAGIHVLNPLDDDTEPLAVDDLTELERAVHGVLDTLADRMTAPSEVHGIPLPSVGEPDPDRAGFVLSSGLGTIQQLAAFYRDWMAVDGWIFDADHGVDDPYDMEKRALGGYFAQLFFAKPTSPPTTVGIILAKADGQPGRKQAVTIHIGETPDDDLPRRSRQLGPNYS